MRTIKRVELTPQQQKLWDDTRAALIWHCPAFSHIFYTMLQNTGTKHNAVFTDDDSIPIAATDGNNLIFNVGPKGFFRFNLNQRVFIASHEILHCIFNHCGISFMLKLRGKVAYPDGKTLPFDAEQMNEAEDFVINAILTESKVGQFPTDESNQPLGLLDLLQHRARLEAPLDDVLAQRRVRAIARFRFHGMPPMYTQWYTGCLRGASIANYVYARPLRLRASS